jgi:bleomycin hydrolase
MLVMLRKLIAPAISGILLISAQIEAQPTTRDSAYYAEKTIWGKKKTVLTFDLSRIVHPAAVADFHPVFHTPPVRQDTTSTCWCFSGTSLLESELFRLHGQKLKLSEMFTVYWEYVDKARRFIREKGNSAFGEGSEQEAVMLRMKRYGAVRSSDYTGLLNGAVKHNHEKLFSELTKYLHFIRENGFWDEDVAIATVRAILDKHLGRPPDVIEVDGLKMTPVEFLERKLRLPLDEYVNFMSCLSDTFYVKREFKVEDNWWHSREYYNVPLDEWYVALKNAILAGYSAAIGGDVSEPGKDRDTGLCVIPTFDIPQSAIDQNAREFRIDNGTTGDDHGIHLIGFAGAGEHDWFLIKDSGSSGHEGPYKGYMFYRDDFVKLKMLTFTVHRDAVKSLLKKCGEK